MSNYADNEYHCTVITGNTVTSQKHSSTKLDSKKIQGSRMCAFGTVHLELCCIQRHSRHSSPEGPFV